MLAPLIPAARSAAFPSPRETLPGGDGSVSDLLLAECRCRQNTPYHTADSSAGYLLQRQWALQTNKRIHEVLDLYRSVVSCLWKFHGICGIWWKMLTILLRALSGAYPSQPSERGFVFIFFSKKGISVLPSHFSSHLHVIMSSLFTKIQNLQGWQQWQKWQNQQDCFFFCLVTSPSLVFVWCRTD